VRRFTKITLIVLFVLILVTAIVQFTQGEPTERYPGPVSGTPLPSLSPTP
jgi:hypothetical protein